jgi:hypothetical protein
MYGSSPVKLNGFKGLCNPNSRHIIFSKAHTMQQYFEQEEFDAVITELTGSE